MRSAGSRSGTTRLSSDEVSVSIAHVRARVCGCVVGVGVGVWGGGWGGVHHCLRVRSRLLCGLVHLLTILCGRYRVVLPRV
jgi:hypothetical protein